MREEGVLKLSHLYMFSRQRTNGTFAAPSVGEIYGESSCFNEYQYNTQRSTKLPKIVSLGFLLFL